MGAVCHSKPRNETRSRSSVKATTYKVDELLKFFVKLSNIKGRSIPNNSSYVKIDFAGEKQFRTSDIIGVVDNYLWPLKQEFEFEITRKALKTATVKFVLVGKDGKEIASTVANLINTASGPIHHDLVLQRNDRKTDSRLTFDLKMSQSVSMVVRTQKIRCVLAENPKEKEYNYSLKMIGYHRDFHSEHSTNLKNPLFKTNVIHEMREDVPENYHAKDLDEGKRLKLKNSDKAADLTKSSKLPQKKVIDDGTTSPKTDNTTMRSSLRIIPKVPVKQVQLTHETSKVFPDEEEISPKRRPSALSKQDINLQRQDQIEDVIPSSPTLPSRGHDNYLKSEVRDTKKELLWNYTEKQEDIPSMEMSISGSDFSTNSIQFYLWSVKSGESQATTKEAIFIDHKLVGECYISLNKIYSEMSNSESEQIEDEERSRVVVRRRVKISEKFWNHGVYMGMLEGEFICEYNPFYRQMICGVYSDSGVQKSTTVVQNKESKSIFDIFKSTLNKEVKLLNQLKDSLIENVFKLSDSKIQYKNQGKTIDDIASNLIKILELLKSSHKESLTTFIYRSSEDLLTSQKVLIDLSRHLMEYCDQVPLVLRPLYYECLTSTTLRGELELNFMGFDTETYNTLMESASKASFKNHQGVVKGTVDVKNVKQKMKVATSYQTFLYETLEKVLKVLNHKGLIEKERDFVETFCAVAYFRIPEFRVKLLNCFNSSSDEGVSITEWRGTEWLLDNEPDDRKKNQHIVSLFDWDKIFYFYLKGTTKGDQNAEFLQNILDDTKWQKRFSKRGIAFYFFLNEWTKHVNKTVVIKDHVPWQDLPGYNILIKNYLLELKKRDVKHLPEALVDTSVTLLRNEKLLNIFIAIIYNKTRVYDSNNVFAVFETINTWLKAIQAYKKKIPSTFDYNFFFKGLFLVIDGDHALNIAKALCVIYNNFNVFSPDRKIQICDYLLGKGFFKLFLHWSFNVRQVYHHLLIFRFYHQHRTSAANPSNLEDLKVELHLYNQKRNDYSKSQKNLLIYEFINAEYSRCMTIIENAYKKVIDDTHRQAVESRLRQRSNKYQKLRLQSSGNLLSQVSHPLRRNSFSTSPVINALGVSKNDSSDASFFVLNSDKLDTSLNANNGKADDGFNPFFEDNEKKLKSLNQDDSPSLGLKLQSLSQGARALSAKTEQSKNNLNENENENDNDEKKAEQVVIRRKFMYYDKGAQRYNEIPKELMVYLLRAYGEYEEIKKSYLRWIQELNIDLSGKTEEEKNKILANPPVPELIVKIPLDEGESDAIQPDDW